MLDWSGFEKAAPEIAAAGRRLLRSNEVAFLATVAGSGRPRLHPFVPKIVDGRLLAFIVDWSPKIADLEERGQYAIHALPGEEDEEFFVSGKADCCDTDSALRAAAADEMGFAGGVDQHHTLYEFGIDRALWTQWLDFGTPSHRPKHTRWSV